MFVDGQPHDIQQMNVISDALGWRLSHDSTPAWPIFFPSHDPAPAVVLEARHAYDGWQFG